MDGWTEVDDSPAVSLNLAAEGGVAFDFRGAPVTRPRHLRPPRRARRCR